VGLYPTGSDELCESIAVDVRGAQFACEADPDIMKKKRTKLLSNVNNCLAVMGDDSKEASTILNEALIAEVLRYLRGNFPVDNRVFDAKGFQASFRPHSIVPSASGRQRRAILPRGYRFTHVGIPTAIYEWIGRTLRVALSLLASLLAVSRACVAVAPRGSRLPAAPATSSATSSTVKLRWCESWMSLFPV
jgi:hypothetical protein